MVTLISPPNGGASNNHLPTVVFVPTSILATPVDVVVEWREVAPSLNNAGTAWMPAPTYTQTLLALSSGDQHSVQPPTPLPNRAWYYRLRAGNSSTNVWGAWTEAARYINVQAPLGSVVSYSEFNIGVPFRPSVNAVAYSELNIGVAQVSELISSAAYSDLNVGVLPGWKLTAAYSDLNVHPLLVARAGAIYADLNVTTDRPDPQIWWIRPEQGKEGYVFNIYGHGFGDFQNQYDGKVKLGNLYCSISTWQKVPAQALASTVRVSGTPRTTLVTSQLPYVLLNSSSYVVQAGDIIEYDMMWELPGSSRLDIFPYFTVDGQVIGYGTTLSDTEGKAWVSDQPEAYGTWKHRKFVVPAGHFMVGRTLKNFGIAWYESNVAAPVRTGSIRSFVIRNSAGVVQRWITGDDQTTTPAMTYVANTGVLSSSEFSRAGHVIEHGQGLDADTITPEHGWIVAVVPTGAVSSMVQVVLEDD